MLLNFNCLPQKTISYASIVDEGRKWTTALRVPNTSAEVAIQKFPGTIFPGEL
jgi:hypothetical protein